MEEKYLLVGGTIDSTEDESECWCEEFDDLETARKAMEASVPVRDASRAISPGYFIRIDQWDDEIDGWQPCERGHTWTVIGFDDIRPDEGFSHGFEVAGTGPDRALCPDFDLLAEAVAHVAESGPYTHQLYVPDGYAAWLAPAGWVGVRPLWGEGPHACNINGSHLGCRDKLAGAVETPWAACRREMSVKEGAAELAAVGLIAKRIHSTLGQRCRGKDSALKKVGRGFYRYMP